MKTRGAVALTAICVLLATACTAGGGSSATPTSNPSASHAPVTLTVWSMFTQRQLKQFNSVLDQVHTMYPWITVKSVGGKSSDDIDRSMTSNTAPDVAIECCPDASAKYCSTGSWLDLNAYLKQDGTDLAKVSPPAATKYTSYKGVQCSLPMLSDAYGLYYNVDMFKKAGITSPPKTFSELSADAIKLTQMNSNGTFKVLGFLPLNDWETAQLPNGTFAGAQYYNTAGQSTVATDPRWTQMIQWQKSLVDHFGYTNLTKWFQSIGGANAEWTASQAFETGKLAMALDGEWRVAFIQADKSKVNYATAPFPVADNMVSEYGMGQVDGTIIGIPKGVPNPEDSWDVVKYLALNTQAEVRLAQLLKNVPTTTAALHDPSLAADPHFATFLKIFLNPNSGYKQITPLGLYDVDTLTGFIDKYLAGTETNLQAGLQGVAKQINDQTQLG